ncbi:diguanylate cyclase, partial [Salmonella enterica subsp. enterica serovar Typhimurium]|nr:diguanylate cyclase [Salmonella enterica subsp. enterica serovar Typhimurium]
FILVLLDFRIFNSASHSGIASGTELLVSISNLLQASFPDAIAMARYAGDRFAMLLPQTPRMANERMAALNANSPGNHAAY